MDAHRVGLAQGRDTHIVDDGRQLSDGKCDVSVPVVQIAAQRNGDGNRRGRAGRPAAIRSSAGR
jgi:hypothetical protein